MQHLTISSQFQVEIPRSILESLGVQPGQSLQVILYENRLELIPVRSLEQMRGFLAGIDTNIEREGDRL